MNRRDFDMWAAEEFFYVRDGKISYVGDGRNYSA